MRRMSWWLIVMVLCAPLAAHAGKLENVEKKVSEHHSSSSDNHSSYHRSSYYDNSYYYPQSTGDVLADTFLGLLFNLLTAGPFAGLEGVGWKERHHMLRQSYDPIVPTVRLEGDYQRLVHDNIQAYHLNATVGYLAFALDGDFTHYFDKTTSTQLKFISPHFLTRFAPSEFVQVDLALGAKILRGSHTHTGFEVGFPTYFYLGKHVILDLKNYFAFVNGAHIYDGSVGIGGKWKLLGARVAYRLISIDGERLHGPEAGLVFQW